MPYLSESDLPAEVQLAKMRAITEAEQDLAEALDEAETECQAAIWEARLGKLRMIDHAHVTHRKAVSEAQIGITTALLAAHAERERQE
jgi:hypothetical protein